MNAGECQRLRFWRSSNNFWLCIASDSSAAQLPLIIKKQLAAGMRLAHAKGGERLIVAMELHHALKVNGAHDVDVMKKNRFRGRTGIVKKKPAGLFQTAACVE